MPDTPESPGTGRQPLPDLLPPYWHRQPTETTPAWEAFKVYLELGEKRTLQKTAKARGYTVAADGTVYDGTIAKWAVKWRWRLRAEAHDGEADRRIMAARMKARVKEEARTATLWERRKAEVLENGYQAAEHLRRKVMAAIEEPHKKGQISPKDQALMLAKALEMMSSIVQAATKPIDQYQPHELHAIAEATTDPADIQEELARLDEVEVDERAFEGGGVDDAGRGPDDDGSPASPDDVA